MTNYEILCSFPDFLSRYQWLSEMCHRKLIGDPTFGGKRYLNQELYHSDEWRKLRNKVMIRDDGCDLGISDRPISGRVIVHHISPITIDTIHSAFDPENLICCSHNTHEAIHYGSDKMLFKGLVERKPNDQCPWR